MTYNQIYLVNRIHQRFAIDHILFQVSYYLFRILYQKMDTYCTNAKAKAFGNITEDREHNKKFVRMHFVSKLVLSFK